MGVKMIYLGYFILTIIKNMQLLLVKITLIIV